MEPIHNYIKLRLQQRKDENNYRQLRPAAHAVDFTANDYLGLARNIGLRERVEQELHRYHQGITGSTGSRLLSGNTAYAVQLEQQIATFHNSGEALLFNSGFDANYGLLSTLPYRGDTIIYDELVHASMHDGIRTSRAAAAMFAHNHMGQLEQQLQKAKGLKYVVVESVYSMDGDFAPLAEIAALCNRYNAGLIVDEAHATGVFGPNGEGLVQQLGLQHACLARIHTFGKAVGAFGAAVICSPALKQFLVNYCRPFIYSTALPVTVLAAIKCAYQYLPQAVAERRQLKELIDLFRQKVTTGPAYRLVDSESPIQSIIVAGNHNIKQFADFIQGHGFDVRPILYPTVAKGGERIRICLHSYNSPQEVAKLAETINSFETAMAR